MYRKPQLMPAPQYRQRRTIRQRSPETEQNSLQRIYLGDHAARVASWSGPSPPRRRSQKNVRTAITSYVEDQTIRMYLIGSVRLIPQARMVAKLQAAKKLTRMILTAQMSA